MVIEGKEYVRLYPLEGMPFVRQINGFPRGVSLEVKLYDNYTEKLVYSESYLKKYLKLIRVSVFGEKFLYVAEQHWTPLNHISDKFNNAICYNIDGLSIDHYEVIPWDDVLKSKEAEQVEEAALDHQEDEEQVMGYNVTDAAREELKEQLRRELEDEVKDGKSSWAQTIKAAAKDTLADGFEGIKDAGFDQVSKRLALRLAEGCAERNPKLAAFFASSEGRDLAKVITGFGLNFAHHGELVPGFFDEFVDDIRHRATRSGTRTIMNEYGDILQEAYSQTVMELIDLQSKWQALESKTTKAQQAAETVEVQEQEKVNA